MCIRDRKKRIGEARAMKHRLRFDLMRETNRIDKEELELFEYKLAKYMYELKAHAKLNKHIDKEMCIRDRFWTGVWRERQSLLSFLKEYRQCFATSI